MKPILIEGGLFVDDRGAISFVNNFNFKDVKRFYMVENHQSGFIRAWHGHEKESKYVFVVQGSALFGTVSMNTYDIYKFTLSARNPRILHIPSGYYNGFKTLEEGTKIMFFSTSTLEESMGDDIRQDYDKWDIWEENYR